MVVKEICAKSILRKYKRIDSWFISCYGMNFYRGCLHNCIYCDGRNEKYQVDGNFGEDVVVKINAVDILKNELRPSSRKKPLKPCFFMLGGGVGDSYQPIEETYQITRNALHLMKRYRLPISILTKSTLIKRDIELLKEINEQSRVLINMSFSSTNDEISSIFEPGVTPPSKRLGTLKAFKDQGFSCGMFLMPVIPFITDTADIMRQTIQDAADAGIDYIIFSGMTLKQGRQKEYFYQILRKYYLHLMVQYENIYKNNKWGQTIPAYYKSINSTFNTIMKAYHLPKRIPGKLFVDILNENDFVSVILDQMDYLMKTQGKKSPFGYASYQISKLNDPVSSMRYELQNIRGIGRYTEKIIQELIDTKTCKLYVKLLYSK